MQLKEIEKDPTSNVRAEPVRVIHFVDALGGEDRLWGKENVIVSLMQAQRASERVDAELITFTPGLLAETMRQAGFKVHILNDNKTWDPVKTLAALRGILNVGTRAIIHTHEYKANIVGRLARARGIAMRKLVATDHGWVDSTPQLEVYFAIDRWTAGLSNSVTVTDPAMLRRFPRLLPMAPIFIPNAVTDMVLPTNDERSAARARFNIDPDALAIGSLGRLTKNKGILDILAAAERTRGTNIVWLIAGSGALSDAVQQCGLPNVRYVGYQADNSLYLRALDAYVQASYFEGLSLSLLEAMRAGLPCIASRAGATNLALRDSSEALLTSPGNLDELVAAALQLHADGVLKKNLGAMARKRFEDAFTIERQHQAFLNVYLA